jgi:hypothetical protein
VSEEETERRREWEMGRLSERENWEKVTEVIIENKVT